MNKRDEMFPMDAGATRATFDGALMVLLMMMLFPLSCSRKELGLYCMTYRKEGS